MEVPGYPYNHSFYNDIMLYKMFLFLSLRFTKPFAVFFAFFYFNPGRHFIECFLVAFLGC